jgi:hypothetical protein
VHHRVDLGSRQAMPHRLQREPSCEASVEQRHDHLGLADRYTPRVEVPFGVLQEAAADEHVHDPHPDRDATPRPAGFEASGLGRLDPEPGGLHEPVQRRVAGICAGERERLDDRVLGVREQRRCSREAERSRTEAPEGLRPAEHPISVKPLGVAL